MSAHPGTPSLHAPRYGRRARALALRMSGTLEPGETIGYLMLPWD